MAVTPIKHTIYGDAPGRTTLLNGFRIGPQNSNRKAYLQGALHSDEQPGIMALHHLLPMLIEADRNDHLNGEFVIFPMVNPLGLGNIEFGMHQGRYDVPSGVNFNRQWPDLFSRIEPVIENRPGNDRAENTRLIRTAIAEWLTGWTPASARDQLRKAVIGEAANADYVFDLHCDNIADVHIFSAPHCNRQMQSLASAIDARAILTADDSGGGSFDEVFPLVYSRARQKYPQRDIAIPCAACTIELRGRADVSDDYGLRDARGLYAFFQGEGMIDGEISVKLAAPVTPTPLNATEMLRVSRAGLLAYKVGLGDRVKTGDVIADLIDLETVVDTDNPGGYPDKGAFLARQPVVAGTDGFILSINANKYVWPGCSIAKIVGTRPLEGRGEYLLED